MAFPTQPIGPKLGEQVVFPPTAAEIARAEQERADHYRSVFSAEKRQAEDLARTGVIPREILDAHLASLWAHLFVDASPDPYVRRAEGHPLLSRPKYPPR